MDCSGSITVASLRWLGCGGCGDIPQGGTGIALAFWPCALRLKCRYTTQWDAGVALAGCYEPTCQVLLSPYTHLPCRSCYGYFGAHNHRYRRIASSTACTALEIPWSEIKSRHHITTLHRGRGRKSRTRHRQKHTSPDTPRFVTARMALPLLP
jgi:hypothetical protein